MRALAAAVMTLALAAVPAAAQDRSPAERQVLLELARTLGEAHGLRAVCKGGVDQRWRNRMYRVIELEAPDAAFEARLTDGFNTGYQAAEAEHPRCDAAAEKRAAQVAARGRDLAQQLAGGRIETASR
jgi:uncharacterized protein (TIGR02301 family)